MDYSKAEGIRKKGLAGLITDNLVEGQGIGSSFGSAISDRTKATFTGIQEKFDPLNIAKKLTGGSNLVPALLGRLTGRKQSSIEYFAGKKSKSSGSNALTNTFKNGYAPGNESMTEVLGMIYDELKSAEEDRKKLYEARKKEEKNSEDREIERNQAIVAALTARRKKEEEEKKKAKEEKEKPKGATLPKRRGKGAEPTKKGAEPTKAETPKTTTKPEPKVTAPKATPAPKPTPKAETPPAPVPKTTTPKTATPTKPSPIIPQVVTGAAAGVALTSISDAAIARIKEKEGLVLKAYFDPKQGAARDLYSVGHGHQINDKELKDGFISVGDKKISVLGENGKNTVITKEDADKLLRIDYPKYEQYARQLPNFDKLNDGAQIALIDMTYNMGIGWAKGWPIFLKQLENMDLTGAAKNIEGSLYIKQVGKRGVENSQAIKNGAKNVPKLESKENIPSTMIESSTKENKDLKSSLNNTTNAQTTLNNTNINQTVNESTVKQRKAENDRPAILEKGRG